MIVYNKKSPENNPIEIVEKKGLGHPDTFIDNIADIFSIELNTQYLETYGKIFHNNVDKGLLVGGQTNVYFGGGELIKKINLTLAGRAIKKDINFQLLLEHSLNKYLSNFKNLDNSYFNLEYDINQGSSDLIQLTNVESNDTSFGVGYAPLTTLEMLVDKITKYLNLEYKFKHPFVGEDVKVMGIRKARKFEFIIACAFVSKYVSNLEEYYALKDKLKEDISKYVSNLIDDEFTILINNSDVKNRIYLTLSGTSLESGDDGQIGRGNRANGLITPFRMMTLEAVAGKNPINHVGKIYSLLSFDIANDIYKELDVNNVDILLLGRIGRKIYDPELIYIDIDGSVDENKINYIISYHLERLKKGNFFKEYIQKYKNKSYVLL